MVAMDLPLGAAQTILPARAVAAVVTALGWHRDCFALAQVSSTLLRHVHAWSGSRARRRVLGWLDATMTRGKGLGGTKHQGLRKLCKRAGLGQSGSAAVLKERLATLASAAAPSLESEVLRRALVAVWRDVNRTWRQVDAPTDLIYHRRCRPRPMSATPLRQRLRQIIDPEAELEGNDDDDDEEQEEEQEEEEEEEEDGEVHATVDLPIGKWFKIVEPEWTKSFLGWHVTCSAGVKRGDGGESSDGGGSKGGAKTHKTSADAADAAAVVHRRTAYSKQHEIVHEFIAVKTGLYTIEIARMGRPGNYGYRKTGPQKITFTVMVPAAKEGS